MLGSDMDWEERPWSLDPTCLQEQPGKLCGREWERVPHPATPSVRGPLGITNRKPSSAPQRGAPVNCRGREGQRQAGAPGGNGDPALEGRVRAPPTALAQTFIEAVLIHVPVDIEVLPRREGQLSLRVLIRPVEGVVTRGRNKTHSADTGDGWRLSPSPCPW